MLLSFSFDFFIKLLILLILIFYKASILIILSNKSMKIRQVKSLQLHQENGKLKDSLKLLLSPEHLLNPNQTVH